jgi:hypothetical protein
MPERENVSFSEIKTTGATIGAGIAYLSGAPEFTPYF